MKKHYDVGIYGWWGHENFGGCLTYFALERTIKNLGYSVLMVQEATGLPGRYVIPDNCIAMTFAKQHYDCSPQVDVRELGKFNQLCDAFIVGGDQLWNNRICFSKEDSFLNFVDENKTKLSYSTSFGTADFNPPKSFIDATSPLLKRFDAVSVREDYAVDIAKKFYGVNATQLIDAVFLPDVEEYRTAAKKANAKLPSKKYLLAFILNPTEAKRKQIEKIAEKLKLDIICVPDAASAYHKNFADVFEGLNILSPLSVSNFLYAYDNASYIVTDSFHGTCMAYVFKKDFSVYYNTVRGADRFVSLMNTLELESRRVFEESDPAQIINNTNVDFNVNWTAANTNVAREKTIALSWLKTHLSQMKRDNFSIPSSFYKFMDIEDEQRLHENPDFIKIRLLATLLRDYGIKHVVLSPGGRDVPLIRMFENNADQFILHRVTDERSAAYFGLGIAAQLRQPVACVCTSGTAASNYLPAVTEAYYTGIPLIMITADRREIYLNQGEDQTIPQKNIYSGVVKKEVSLPEGGGKQAELQSRRDISDCILESTHNTPGPVHINITIDNISIGAKLPRSAWSLLPFVYPHILRAGFNNGPEKMMDWVNSLKKSQRILVVYGQNPPPTETQLKYIEDFAKKYNCVIVTDHISNLNCAYSLQPFVMLNSISQAEFNTQLSPDILITVGGKRLMNDPLTFKIRGGYGNIRHWSVSPDGKIRDYYFRLSSVLECSQDYFFRYFAEKAGDALNNGVYYGKWKELNDKVLVPVPKSFNAHYIQSKFLPAIPKSSILHLGVGQSFFDCRRYKLDKTVDVFCNMGTNGIDGCTSTFMGQCAVTNDRLCFLLVGDLSFFYDMNSIWNKNPGNNVRILMVNNNGSGLLRSHNLRAVTSQHNTSAEGWVRSTGFEYISAKSPEEFDKLLPYFISEKTQKPVFFEVFCE